MIAPVGEASWGEDARLAASLASAEAWPSFASELAEAGGEPVPYRRLGSLHVALDRDETAELRRLHELHERLGLEAAWMRAAQCRRLEPGLATSAAGGVEIPGEAEVDPRAVLRALRSAFISAGGEIREEAATGVELAGGSARGVRLAGGELVEAERTVVAAGARSGELLPEQLVGLPSVRPVKGEILRLAARPGEMPCERIVVTERVYVVPREGGEVVVGATSEERGFDRRVTAGGVHELLREAYRVLPEIAELELVETSAGLRPATADNAPLIGETAIDGLLLATGHHRNGILLAPFTADAVLAILTGGEPPEALAALDPGRRERIGS